MGRFSLEKDALWAVREQQSDPPTGSSISSWIYNANHCEDWAGVSCDEAGRVSSVSLHDNQLTGTLPPQLSALTGLIGLWLYNNQLTGTVPLQLSTLTGLDYLYLHNNQLTGTVPPQLSTLTGLSSLYLYNNQLTGTVPPQLSTLTGLDYLILHNNTLTGTVPPQLSPLTGLDRLYLYNNQLTGTVPPQLSTLTGLDYLYLHENQLTGTVPPQLSTLTGLDDLRLSNNQLTGTVPLQLSALTGLSTLDVSSNFLSTGGYYGGARTLPTQKSRQAPKSVPRHPWSCSALAATIAATYTTTVSATTTIAATYTTTVSAATIAATCTATVSTTTIAAATYTATVSTTTITATTYTTTVSATTTTIATTYTATGSATTSNAAARLRATSYTALHDEPNEGIDTLVDSSTVVSSIPADVADATADDRPGQAMRPLQPGSHRQAPSLRRISAAQLEAALGTAPHALGSGGFGSVFRGTLEGSPVAIKMLDEEGLQGRPEYRTEVELLARLRHRHIVAIYAACEERHAMVMELLEGGTLEDRLREGDVAWNVRLRMMYDACVGLLFLHNSSPAIMHRDFKPSNILLSQSGMAKLGDVGLAKEAPLGGSRLSTHSSVVGSLGFIDLQYLNTGVYRAASDVYSVGVTLLLVLLGRTDATGVVSEMVDARADGDEMDILDRRPGAGSWDMEKAARVMSLALQCVHSSHLRRPTLEAVVEQLSEFKDAVPANQGSSMSATSSGPAALNMEEWLTCPLSMDLMEDPVLAEDGWTYERAMIQEHLRHRAVSPMTNLPIGTALMPNRIVKSLTEEWRSRNSG
eukprot:jgi/Tetstr1/430960/TSEL_020715.t1